MDLSHYLACDLGAESGRIMLGAVSPDAVSVEEIQRFPNTPLRQEGSLHWNIPKLMEDFFQGLAKAAQTNLPFRAFSADSWGVDYILLDGEGQIIHPTFHYRDSRTERGFPLVFEKIDRGLLYEETGIQFLPLNAIYQLAVESPERLNSARALLGVADAFNYLLTGRIVVEESMASTFQLYNPRTRNWSPAVIDRLGLPKRIFPPIVASGTRLGPVRAEALDRTGLQPLEVVAGCSHDTGAAVAAVPASGDGWAYLSSGTWSLMGVELAKPLITERSRELNFTNEVGFGGTIRFLKNIVGLWIIQECRRFWGAHGQNISYQELTQMASAAPPFAALINPADARFLFPGDMPEKIAQYCRETSQPAPESPGQIARCVLESLALLYRKTFDEIQEAAQVSLDRLHVVGGGCQNHLLNQFTANALEAPVLAGPVEATSTGNVLAQAIALGEIASLAEARERLIRSTAVVRFTPSDRAAWIEARRRFADLN